MKVIRQTIVFTSLLFCGFTYAKELPLHIAASEGDVARIEKLLKKGHKVDVPTRDERMDTPLYYALGHLDAAAVLLEHGADPNKLNGAGYAPIHYVSNLITGNIEALKLLMAHGGNINLRASNGTSVLQNALQDDNTELVLYAIDNGADPEVKGTFDEPLICAAIAHKNIEVVSKLIEKKVDLKSNACSVGLKAAYSPLHRAAYSCSLDIAQLLVASGVDTGLRSVSGITALQLADDEGCDDVAEYLNKVNQRL